jgi:glutaminyl-tRNA synthetase
MCVFVLVRLYLFLIWSMVSSSVYPAEAMKADRGERLDKPRACIHRDKPIADSLTEFQAMRDGKYRPGEAILRLKQDLDGGNPYMWDVVAYRVLNKPHHR